MLQKFPSGGKLTKFWGESVDAPGKDNLYDKGRLRAPVWYKGISSIYRGCFVLMFQVSLRLSLHFTAHQPND